MKFRIVSLFAAFCFPLYASLACIKHTEGKGLGYVTGYSTLQLFTAAPLPCNLLTFADLRGHCFNNGKLAANLGLGLRWAPGKWILGANGFYDLYQTSQLWYHQASFGLEALGETLTFRLNGYFPVGRKKTNIFAFSYPSLIPFRLKATEQLAMNGLDGEIGAEWRNLYAGIGPYGYWGRTAFTENAFRAVNKHFYGGRLRLSAAYLNYFTLEGIVTYDTRFKWRGQIVAAITFPSPCESYKPVLRNEIIVNNRLNRYSNDPAVLDPENVP